MELQTTDRMDNNNDDGFLDLDSLLTDFIEDDQEEASGDVGQREGLFFGNLPHLVIVKIFDQMTIGEKLRTISVSKAWYYSVIASLRKEEEFSLDQFSPSAKSVTFSEKNLHKLLINMCQFPSCTLRMRKFDIKNICCDSPSTERRLNIFPTRCPNLEVATGAIPPATLSLFAGSCKNLRSLTITGSHQPFDSASPEWIIRSLVNECTQLKHLDIPYLERTEDNSVDSPFQDARCSLESLAVHLLNQDVPAIVQRFPDLKHLKDTYKAHRGEVEDIDFRLMKDLPLESLVLRFVGRFAIDLFFPPTMCNFPLSRSLECLVLGGSWKLVDADTIHHAATALIQISLECPKLNSLTLTSCAYLPFLPMLEIFGGTMFSQLRTLKLNGSFWISDYTFSLPNLENLEFGFAHPDDLPAEFTRGDLLKFLPGCPKLRSIEAWRVLLSEEFFTRWSEEGRNCSRPWKAPLEIVILLTCLDLQGDDDGSQLTNKYQDTVDCLDLDWKITVRHDEDLCYCLADHVVCRRREDPGQAEPPLVPEGTAQPAGHLEQ